MDIQKEREVFEQALVNQKNVSINNLHVCTIFDAEKNKYSPSDVCDPKEDFIVDWINSSWSIWQSAKAQAVPEGFVLIKDDTKTVVAIERMVEQQVEASGMDSRRLERLDGWKIIEAAVKAQEPTND
ncbi:hypothetical protein [Acinetobacter variabilis]|uniref:hypothetical protein n=1 Tax=Acinetobacter variabilis TaxID=70346 RepID=UPI00289B3CA2|nr:hypothetical protein [Acinetobacter variabilis]